jgi:excisionase family DNA binding protein
MTENQKNHIHEMYKMGTSPICLYGLRLKQLASNKISATILRYKLFIGGSSMNDQLKQIRKLIKELDVTPYLLTYQDAADILKVKAPTLRKWVSAGKIDYVKIGSAVRFKREHINTFIEKSTRKARR